MWEKLVTTLAGYEGAREGYCVAFSGGADSSLVLAAACAAGGWGAAQTNPEAAGGARPVHAVYFSTALHPKGEREEARQAAGALGARFAVIEVDELAEAGIENNPPDRCYRCKRLLFTKLREYARCAGLGVLLDGSNADDRQEFRPGLRALGELGIKSPLMELGLSKKEVRALCTARGMAVGGKPSSPCLATRIEYNTPLTREDLERVGRAEEFLKALGFDAVRVRKQGGLARIEAPPSRLAELLGRREEITRELLGLGFWYVTLDLQGLRSGSMDLALTPGQRARFDPGRTQPAGPAQDAGPVSGGLSI